MKIIIPNDYKKIEKLKNDRELKSKIILSPFVYMDYEKAIVYSCKLIKKNYNEDVYIVDPTGLFINVFFIFRKNLEGKSEKYIEVLEYKNEKDLIRSIDDVFSCIKWQTFKIKNHSLWK